MFGRSKKEPFELSDELAADVDVLLARGERYAAIRLVRERTGSGLVTATQAVDHRA